jgi:hypothetical protein
VTGFSRSSSVSPVSIVPAVLDIHLHLHVASYHKDKGAKARNSCVRLNVYGFTRQAGRQNVLDRMIPGIPCNKSSEILIGSVVPKYFTFATFTKDLFGCRCVVLPAAFMHAAPQ